MKVVILAGGLGSRLGPISEVIPKPMIRIGDNPILWHIMKIYASHGFRDFVICLGYKGNMIKEYFYNYSNHICDFTINLKTSEIQYHNGIDEYWNVTLAETGLNTLKGGRIKRIEKYIADSTNMLTYGDGVADIDIKRLLDFHKSHNKLVTITSVRPPSMFGEILERKGQVISFEEKPQTSKGLISGGFMVFDKKLFDYLSPDEDCDFEFGALEQLAREGQVMTFKHKGFWESADTVRDVNFLNKLWNSGKASWKTW